MIILLQHSMFKYKYLNNNSAEFTKLHQLFRFIVTTLIMMITPGWHHTPQDDLRTKYNWFCVCVKPTLTQHFHHLLGVTDLGMLLNIPSAYSGWWDFWELKGCPIWEWTKKGGRCLCGGFLSKLCPLNFSNPYLVCWRNIKMIPILILLIHNIGKYWSHVLVSVNLSFPENHVTNPGPALLTPTMIILCHCNFPQILQ